MTQNEPLPAGKPTKRKNASQAAAYALASECTAIALGMVTPGLLGWWLDGWMGCYPVLAVLGFTAGFVYGVWRLIRFGKRRGKQSKDRRLRRNKTNDLPGDQESPD